MTTILNAVIGRVGAMYVGARRWHGQPAGRFRGDGSRWWKSGLMVISSLSLDASLNRWGRCQPADRTAQTEDHVKSPDRSEGDTP